MRVRDLMQREVFTVAPDDPVDRLFFLLHYEKIRHVPVLDKGEVVGIVSDRDLYKALGPRSRSRSIGRRQEGTVLYVIPRKVRHLMRRGIISIGPDEDAGKAAAMMGRRKIGALPVVRDRTLVGIVTSTDLLLAFSRLRRMLEKAEKAVAATRSG